MTAKPDPRHKVVVAALIERDGLLLARQRPEGTWGAGMWEFPGGKVDAGEDPRVALARECQEELGCAVHIGEPYDVLSHRYDDLGSLILLFFRARIVSGEPFPVEGGDLRWMKPDDLASLNWLPADVPLVERWVREAQSRN